jgi:ribosome recycling factor
MVRLIGQRIEGARISIRQIRQEAMKEVDQAFEEKQLSEDEKFRFREEIQKIVDGFNKAVEEIGKVREQELMTL